jgi:Cft2 family RNA processing exonuclease
MPFVRDPSVFERADYIVMESTYGDRDHEDPGRVDELLGGIIRETAKAGGNVVVPTFAIERAQDLMFHLSRLVRSKAIPPMPVYLDSPMAREVTEAFERHDEFLDEEARKLFASEEHPFRFPGLVIVRTPEESMSINTARGPTVIMAGSGMCTGGRIKHHLAHNIARPESTILFVGYQARETLGRQILEKAAQVGPGPGGQDQRFLGPCRPQGARPLAGRVQDPASPSVRHPRRRGRRPQYGRTDQARKGLDGRGPGIPRNLGPGLARLIHKNAAR